MLRWLINIFILSEDQFQDWVEKYCRSVIDLCSRLMIFIILKQGSIRGEQDVWPHVEAAGLCFHQSRWIHCNSFWALPCYSLGWELTQQVQTAPAEPLSLELPSFYCWLQNGRKCVCHWCPLDPLQQLHAFVVLLQRQNCLRTWEMQGQVLCLGLFLLIFLYKSGWQ